MLEQKKKERALKRNQMENKRFMANAQKSQAIDKPMSREERKLFMAMQIFNIMEETEQKKNKDAPSSQQGSSPPRDRDTEEEQSALSESGALEKGSRPPSSESPTRGRHLPQESREGPSPGLPGIASFTRARIQSDETDELANTHFNLKHQVKAGTQLRSYIRDYELEVAQRQLSLLEKVPERLLERQAQELQKSQEEGLVPSGDKFCDNLTALCNKMNGMDLSQPVKTLLQQLK